MFYPVATSPLTVGDIISRALRAYRANVALVLRKLIAPTICAAIAALVFQWCATSGLKEEFVNNKDFTKGIILIVTMLASVVALLTSYWVILMRQLAFVRLLTNLSEDYNTALAEIWKRGWSIFGLYILMAVIFLAVFIFISTVIGISVVFIKNIISLGVTLCMVAVLLILTLLAIPFYALALCIMVCEKISIGAAISRTIHCASKNLKRAVGFALLLIAIQTVLSWTINVPIILLIIFNALKDGVTNTAIGKAGYDIPFYLKAIEQAVESTAGMLIGPIHFFAFAIFYFDLRMRKEGIDISDRLKLLEEKVST